MVEMRNSIHICAGDRTAEASVDLWLERGGFRVLRFEDAYSACAYLVTNQEDPPDLVVVGANWLTRDELAIIGYVEQSWPGVAQVVYGFPHDANLQGVPSGAVICRSNAQLRELLERSPSEVASASSNPEPHASIEGNGKRPHRSEEPEHEAGVQVEQASDPPSSPRTQPPREPIDEMELTREELAALLEDSDK